MQFLLFIQWSVVISMLIFLIYAAFVIMEEKRAYLENTIDTQLAHFTFKIPSWWKKKTQEKDNICFGDNNWEISYRWFNSFNEDQDIEEQTVEKIKNTGLLFDEKTIDLKRYKKNPLSYVHIEGMATSTIDMQRKYYDAYLIRDKNKKGYLYCFHKCSILNGMLEGPYFEETIKHIETT